MFLSIPSGRSGRWRGIILRHPALPPGARYPGASPRKDDLHHLTLPPARVTMVPIRETVQDDPHHITPVIYAIAK